MSELSILEYSSHSGELFRDTLRRASEKTLQSCFDSPVIRVDTEKCCVIYAELHRRRHRSKTKKRPSWACGQRR